LGKNEWITNIFAGIARSKAVAILYRWGSNNFYIHIMYSIDMRKKKGILADSRELRFAKLLKHLRKKG